MAEITCPQCGYSLETAGSIATKCPRCESTLDFGETKAIPKPPPISLSVHRGTWVVPPASSSPMIDAAGLMRRVLAEQQPGEDFDAALERIVQAEYPENREKTAKTIESFLNWWQQRFGLSRAEAAQQLAKSSAQLTIFSDIHLNQEEIEKLAPEYRRQLQEQIEKAIREGKPLPAPIITGPERVEFTDVKIQGMEKLPPKYQQQIEEAIREGKPIPTKMFDIKIEVDGKPISINFGKLLRKLLILIALLLGALLLAYLLSLR